MPKFDVSTGDNNADNILEEYYDDDRVLALTLAVVFLGMSNHNPKATPPGVGAALQAAQQFHHYLMGGEPGKNLR